MHLQTKFRTKKCGKEILLPHTDTPSNARKSYLHLLAFAAGREQRMFCFFSLQIIPRPDPFVNPFLKNIFSVFSLPSLGKIAQNDKAVDFTLFGAVQGPVFSVQSVKKRNFERIKSCFLTIYKVDFACYNLRQNARRHLFRRSINLMIPTRPTGHSPCFFLCYIIKL